MRTRKPSNNMKTRTFHFWLPSLVIALALLLPARAVLAQQIILKNATVHTVSGQILPPGQGDVVIENGKIISVGPVNAPATWSLI